MGKFILSAALLCALGQATDKFVESCRGISGPEPLLTVHSVPNKNTVRAYEILSQNCVACHGAGSKSAKKRFDNVLDAEDLRTSGVINSVDPDASVFYQRISLGPRQMPLGEDALSAADLLTIRQWIADGAPDFNEVTDPEKPEPVSYQQEVECISADVSTLSYTDAYYARYLVLSESYNSGDVARFKRTGWAVDKLVNSISFNPHNTNSKRVDYAGVIRRIDLRDYDLKIHDWDVTLLAKYPYAIKFNYPQKFDGYEVNIAQKTGSPRAYVRADWFVNEASTAPLYYDLLHLPKTLQELEDSFFLRSSYYGNYDETLKRAVIRHSGVAHGARVIDSRKLNFWTQGQKIESLYWITYDFDVKNAKNKEANPLALPFGPRELNSHYTGKAASWYTENKVFKHDAGEVIFLLPNGQQGFYLADKDGKRQDEVPVSIATDRKNTAPQIGSTPFAVLTGTSCFSCHAKGMIPFTDDLKNHIKVTAGFSPREADELSYIVPDQQVHTDRVAKHNDIFTKAMALITKDASVFDPNYEPVFRTSKTYAEYLSVDDAAHELKVSPEKLKDCFFRSPELARLLTLSDEKGIVHREAFEVYFDNILYECNIGRQVKFAKKAADYYPPSARCNTTFKNSCGGTVKFSIDGVSRSISSGGSLSLDYAGSRVVSNYSVWLGWGWENTSYQWTAVACKQYAFRLQNRRCVLWSVK